MRARAARDTTESTAGKSSLTILSRLSTSGVEPHPDPLQALLGAFAADLSGCFQRAATKRRLTIDHLEATLHADLGNPMVAVGVIGESGSPAISSIELTLFASTSGEEDTAQQAWQEALQTSSIFQTLNSSVTIKSTFRHL